MKKTVIVLFTLLCLVPAVYAGIFGILIGETDYPCGVADGICPSDYAGCQGCIDGDGAGVNDPDCCIDNACGFWCTVGGVVCEDSIYEEAMPEYDSELETVEDAGVEDCYSTGCGTEAVIDDSNELACVDSEEHGDGYDYTHNCADDGLIYIPYTQTGMSCVVDSSCHDNDDDGDTEVCDAGGWHDPDEAEPYCTAVGGVWRVGTGFDVTIDDFDGDLATGFCQGDDGYTVRGGILRETFRGSDVCEAAVPVTVTLKDKLDVALIEIVDETTYREDWPFETFDCQVGNEVGEFSFSIDPGDYFLVAEAEGMHSVVQEITVSGHTTLEAFWMYYTDECQADCTKNDRVCHAECAGINGCTFQTHGAESVANYCDGLREGYRYVLSEVEDADGISGEEVYCCTGTPQAYDREYFTSEDADTNCVENVISEEKGVWVGGEWVDLHFVVFSTPQPQKAGCEEYQDFCDSYGGGLC